MRKEVIMPKMGLDMTEGTIIRWHKKVGDSIEKDELLLEIETDKAMTDVESAISGTLAEIVVPEEEEVEVGTIIAWIETD